MEWIAKLWIGIWLGFLMIEDLKGHMLSIKAILMGMISVLGIILVKCQMETEILENVLGALLGGSFLVIGKLSKEKLGYGDGMILLTLGLFLGLWEFIEISIVAFFLCFIYGIISIKIKKLQKDSEIAFVPFLLMGYMMVISSEKSICLKGSATIELLYIMPVIFLAFIAVVYLSFFFHDKNILQGLVYEAILIGKSQCRMEEGVDESVISNFLEEKSQEKLIFFPSPEVEIYVTETELVVCATTQKNSMNLKVEKSVSLYIPEEKIRSSNILEDIVKGATSGSE